MGILRIFGVALNQKQGDSVLHEAWDNYDDMIDGIPFESKSEYFPDSIQKRLAKYRDYVSPDTGKSLYSIYNEANSQAIYYQKKNHQCSVYFVAAIAIAVAAALFQDLWFESFIWVVIEISAVIVALSILILQKVLSKFVKHIENYHHLWLIQRHKAERCRFLKSIDLLWPESTGYPEYDKRMNEIQAVDSMDEINHWILQEGIRLHEGLDKIQEMNEKKENTPMEIKNIIRYYLCRRLTLQVQYYKNRYEKNIKNRYAWVKYFLAGLTVLALGIEIVHIILVFLGLDVASDLHEGIRIGVVVLLLVALIPVISSSLQTFIFSRRFQDQATHYLKYFSGLFRLLYNNLMQNTDSSLAEDFINMELKKKSYYFRFKQKKSNFPINENLNPDKLIDIILESLINSCQANRMIPMLREKSTEEEQLKSTKSEINKITDYAENNPYKVLRILIECEDIMEHEHQSWISIMSEAEWI